MKRKRTARKTRGRRRRRRNYLPVDVEDVISAWREYADAEDFSRAAMNAGVEAIRDDPELWADRGLSKLADYVEAWKRQDNKRRGRKRNVLTIADELEAVTYHGGSGKKGQAFIHEYETGVQAIPIVGGVVELPDGRRLKVEPGSVLQRSKEGLPLWMEE